MINYVNDKESYSMTYATAIINVAFFNEVL